MISKQDILDRATEWQLRLEIVGCVTQLMLALRLISSLTLSCLPSAVPRMTDRTKSICPSLIHQKS